MSGRRVCELFVSLEPRREGFGFQTMCLCGTWCVRRCDKSESVM